MPLARTNSLALSAACHHAPDDTDAALLPIMYGVINPSHDDGVEYVGFSSKPVQPLEPEVAYSSYGNMHQENQWWRAGRSSGMSPVDDTGEEAFELDEAHLKHVQPFSANKKDASDASDATWHLEPRIGRRQLKGSRRRDRLRQEVHSSQSKSLGTFSDVARTVQAKSDSTPEFDSSSDESEDEEAEMRKLKEELTKKEAKKIKKRKEKELKEEAQRIGFEKRKAEKLESEKKENKKFAKAAERESDDSDKQPLRDHDRLACKTEFRREESGTSCFEYFRGYSAIRLGFDLR
ncbi:MAG: hypothetical protein M1830_008781, partial [Pleopsidium flavum]